MHSREFTAADRADLAARGISDAEVDAQLRHYAEPPAPTRLVRPCAPGDGIRRLTDAEASGYASRYQEQANSLKIAKFVPASGAASRMFRALLAAKADASALSQAEWDKRAAAGDDDAEAVSTFLARLDDFAFAADLAAALERRDLDPHAARDGDVAALLRTLLDDDALAYASLPKGLLAFHREAGRVRTAFEEHLLEGAAYARGQGDVCCLHFTVSPEHESRFRQLLKDVRAAYEEALGVQFEVEFSHQKSSTDTLAVDPDGQPFRDRNGRLLFRPAGHGALIENLGDIDADLLFVKNIDNVAVEALLATTELWKKALAGVLLELRDVVFAHRRAVETGHAGAVEAAWSFLRETLGVEPGPDTSASAAAHALDRPLRVAGMVSSDTNPGGGPFWVEDRDGRVSAQVVEMSQVDRKNPEQKAILESARHFNPVDLVCMTRDWKGQPHDLSRFIDHEAVFIAEKSQHGRPLRSLERPGLWNGAMAGWNTLFVEVPAQTFNPVKTVNDLLAPAHQGRRP